MTYDNNIDFRIGDWVFVNGSSFVSKTIRAITFSKVSHVGIMEAPGTIFETDITWGKAKSNDVSKYRGYDISVYRPPYNKMQILMVPGLCDKRRNRLYSALDIFTNFIFSPLHPQIRGKIVSLVGNSHFQICSEQVADITHAATGWKEVRNFESFTPDDLLKIAQANYTKIF